MKSDVTIQFVVFENFIFISQVSLLHPALVRRISHTKYASPSRSANPSCCTLKCSVFYSSNPCWYSEYLTSQLDHFVAVLKMIFDVASYSLSNWLVFVIPSQWLLSWFLKLLISTGEMKHVFSVMLFWTAFDHWTGYCLLSEKMPEDILVYLSDLVFTLWCLWKSAE